MKKFLCLLLCLLLCSIAVQADRFNNRFNRNNDNDNMTEAQFRRCPPWKICFVKKDLVFIRMPSFMFRSAKIRAKFKRHGVIRVVLRPRHHMALRRALGRGHWEKIILRVKTERLRRVRGLKGRYVVRPVRFFKHGRYLEEKDNSNQGNNRRNRRW